MTSSASLQSMTCCSALVRFEAWCACTMRVLCRSFVVAIWVKDHWQAVTHLDAA